MNSAGQTTVEPAPRVVSAARDVGRSAPVRCRCYAAFSEMTASPHDVDARASLLARVGAAAGLPYPVMLDELLREYASMDIDQLRAEYSGLFEVGSQGPPAPIREDLSTGQKAGTREELRFYDFGYQLDERFIGARIMFR